MSDYSAASLPIRSDSDGTDQKVVVKVVDGSVGGSNQVTVDSDKNFHVESHGNQPGGADVALALSENGESRVNGIYNASTNTLPSKVGMAAVQRATTPADSDQIKRITAITSSTVHALDISLHDASGNAYTQSNPVPVSVEESPGTEVHDYSKGSALAAAASSNHDYTITALKTLKLKMVMASASGKLKIEVQSSVDGTVFVTKFVGFNSVSNPNIIIPIPALPVTDVGVGSKIRVIRTNLDNQAQDVYSTISGTEL